MKICKDCREEKQQSEFYGIQGECKSCTKKRVQINYRKNIEHYKQYELIRKEYPHRKEVKLLYQKKHRLQYPEKYIARAKVNNGLRYGKIEKKKCMVCKNPKTEAHHPDYSKPLEVVWLCRKHHNEVDKAPF